MFVHKAFYAIEHFSVPDDSFRHHLAVGLSYCVLCELKTPNDSTFTIIERGNQNRQGSAISATKLVPGRVNLVAILVPGGPSLGGGDNAAITVVH